CGVMAAGAGVAGHLDRGEGNAGEAAVTRPSVRQVAVTTRAGSGAGGRSAGRSGERDGPELEETESKKRAAGEDAVFRRKALFCPGYAFRQAPGPPLSPSRPSCLMPATSGSTVKIVLQYMQRSVLPSILVRLPHSGHSSWMALVDMMPAQK